MPPLPDLFNSDLTSVEEKFKEFEDLADVIINAKNLGIELDESFFTKHETLETELIDATETLTVTITDEYESISYEQELLEIILPILNGIVYVITIFVIFKVLQKEGKKLQKLEKLYTIGQMASRLAHDLRNPIHTIKMNLEILQKTSGIEQTVKDKHNRIQRAIMDMTYIIDDVLEFVKTKELHLETHSLLKIISESVSSINVPADVQIELPKEDVSLTCDGRKIQALIVNLLVNSFDAIGKKGTITIKLENNTNSVTIQVIDSGPGIPNDIMSKIFEPMFTSKSTGTGLGLGISKNIAKQHGGKISVENNPTTFTIILPKK
jgi:signal transduction histidine kinase